MQELTRYHITQMTELVLPLRSGWTHKPEKVSYTKKHQP